MHENGIKVWYLIFNSIALAVALGYNDYQTAMVCIIMGFIVASA